MRGGGGGGLQGRVQNGATAGPGPRPGVSHGTEEVVTHASGMSAGNYSVCSRLAKPTDAAPVSGSFILALIRLLIYVNYGQLIYAYFSYKLLNASFNDRTDWYSSVHGA